MLYFLQDLLSSCLFKVEKHMLLSLLLQLHFKKYPGKPPLVIGLYVFLKMPNSCVVV